MPHGSARAHTPSVASKLGAVVVSVLASVQQAVHTIAHQSTHAPRVQQPYGVPRVPTVPCRCGHSLTHCEPVRTFGSTDCGGRAKLRSSSSCGTTANHGAWHRTWQKHTDHAANTTHHACIWNLVDTPGQGLSPGRPLHSVDRGEASVVCLFVSQQGEPHPGCPRPAGLPAQSGPSPNLTEHATRQCSAHHRHAHSCTHMYALISAL